LGLIVALLWWFYPVTAKSVLIGGLIYWIPNVYFTLCVFRFRGASAAKLILQSTHKGEFGKLLLTATGFALAFSVVNPIDWVGLFGAFISMTVYQWCLIRHW
jgi:ATP synthase protein I